MPGITLPWIKGPGENWTKTSFDNYRQNIWDQGKSLVDQHDAMKNNGQLTAPVLSQLITALATLMASFESTYAAALQSVENSWVEPRFHDYYDFFLQRVLPAWEAELRGMMDAQSTIVSIAPPTTGATSQFSSANTTSQASAAGSPVPQLPYSYAGPSAMAPTTEPYTTFEAAPQETAQSAGLSPLIIGGLVLGFLLMRRKGGAS